MGDGLGIRTLVGTDRAKLNWVLVVRRTLGTENYLIRPFFAGPFLTPAPLTPALITPFLRIFPYIMPKMHTYAGPYLTPPRK